MDRTTKLLLAAIAVGLFANAGNNAVRPAGAQYGSSVASDISNMAHDIHSIYSGYCFNSKLC